MQSKHIGYTRDVGVGYTAGMLSPRPNLGLEAQKNWPRPRPCDYWPRPHDSCGLGLVQLGLVAS